MTHDELETVATFETVGAAEAARGRLDAEGVAALVIERDALRFDPFRLEPPPPIRLQVRAADLERARAVLDLPPPRSA